LIKIRVAGYLFPGAIGASGYIYRYSKCWNQYISILTNVKRPTKSSNLKTDYWVLIDKMINRAIVSQC